MSTMTLRAPAHTAPSLTVAGLFAGIGGIELGLHQAGHRSRLLCEVDPGACRVLETHFPDVPLSRDVRELETVGHVDLVAAGFPCQDLSQAGRTAGIRGRNSGLVGHVFRLLDALGKKGPRWLLLENVSFMLQLDRGEGMRFLVHELERRGYAWAYRVVDTRAFGLPQRRQRVLLLASRTEDPRGVLHGQDRGEPVAEEAPELWRGFYWTEGTRGLGWAVDGVPTLKGGSTIGIPSPPAIWKPLSGELGTPDLRDAERLQGFTEGWTLPALQVEGVRRGHRWKLVGNAVSVPVAKWVGERLAEAPGFRAHDSEPLPPGARWPRAAWGGDGKAYLVDRSMWPVRWPRKHLSEFLKHPLTPLSHRAAAGFYARATSDETTLDIDQDFLNAVRLHVERMKGAAA